MTVFFAICVLPLHCFYSRARLEIAKTLGHIVISPFGEVRFRHFFLADVITSMVKPLQDIGYITCFFNSSDWEDGTYPDYDNCSYLWSYAHTISFFPYWFRFMQCFNKYQETKLKAHLVNAGKYGSCLLIQLSAIWQQASLT
jgi:hypothetical protein